MQTDCSAAGPVPYACHLCCVMVGSHNSINSGHALRAIHAIPALAAAAGCGQSHRHLGHCQVACLSSTLPTMCFHCIASCRIQPSMSHITPGKVRFICHVFLWHCVKKRYASAASCGEECTAPAMLSYVGSCVELSALHHVALSVNHMQLLS